MRCCCHRSSAWTNGRALRAGTARSREALMGREIEGRAIGLVGIGEIGRRVARIAQGFGLTVIACDPLLTAEEIRARGAEPVDFDTLLARRHPQPALPAGRGHARPDGRVGLCPHEAGRVVPADERGGIHDEDALLAALDSGHLAGAGWTWRVEPPSPASRLLQHPNVASAFHTGGVTHEGRRKQWRRAPRARSRRCWPASGPSACSIPTSGPGSWNGWRSARGLTD